MVTSVRTDDERGGGGIPGVRYSMHQYIHTAPRFTRSHARSGLRENGRGDKSSLCPEAGVALFARTRSLTRARAGQESS